MNQDIFCAYDFFKVRSIFLSLIVYKIFVFIQVVSEIFRKVGGYSEDI